MSRKKNKATSAARRSASRAKKSAAPSRPIPWVWIAVITLVVVIAAVVLWLLTRNSPAAADSSKEISVNDAYAKYNAGVFLLDVRTAEEWAEYHVPDTTHIPLDELDKRLGELPRDQEIVVICRSGNRSQEGRDILLKAGFSPVVSMAGGLKQWSAAGYPTVTGP